MSDISRPSTPTEQTPILFSKIAQLTPHLVSRLFSLPNKTFIDMINTLSFDLRYMHSLNAMQTNGALKNLNELKLEINKFFELQYSLFHRDTFGDKDKVTVPFPSLSSTVLYELLYDTTIKGVSHKCKGEEALNIINKILNKVSNIFKRNDFMLYKHAVELLSIGGDNYINFRKIKNYFKILRNDYIEILKCKIPPTPSKFIDVTREAHSIISFPLSRSELIKDYQKIKHHV